MKKIVKLCLVLFVLCAFVVPVSGTVNYSTNYTDVVELIAYSSSSYSLSGGAGSGSNSAAGLSFSDFATLDRIDSISSYSTAEICTPGTDAYISSPYGTGYASCRWLDYEVRNNYLLEYNFNDDFVFGQNNYDSFTFQDVVTNNTISFLNPLSRGYAVVTGSAASIGDMFSAVIGTYELQTFTDGGINYYHFTNIYNNSGYNDTFSITVDKSDATVNTKWTVYDQSGRSYYDGSFGQSNISINGMLRDGVFAKVELSTGEYEIITLTIDGAIEPDEQVVQSPIITYYGTDLTIAVSSVKTDWLYSIKFNTAEFDDTTYRYFYNHKYPNGTLMLPSAHLDRQTSLVFPVWVDASALDNDPPGVYTTTLYRVLIAGGSSELLATSQLQVFDTAQSMTTVDIMLDDSEYTVGDMLNYTVNFTNYDSMATYELSIFGPEMLYYHIVTLTGNATGSFLTYTGMLPGSYVIRVHESTLTYIENINDPSSFVLLDYFDTTEPFINVSKDVFTDDEYTEIYGYAPSSKDYYVRVMTRVGAPFSVMNLPVVGYFNIDRSFDSGKYRAELYYQDFVGLYHHRDDIDFDVTSSELDISWINHGVSTSIYPGCAPLACVQARVRYANVTSTDIIEVFSPQGLFLSWNQVDQPNTYDFTFPRGSDYEGEWTARITNSSNSSDYVTSIVQFGDENNKWTGGFSSATLNWRIPLESDEWGEFGSASRYKFVDTAYTTDDIELIWTATNLTNTYLRIFGNTVEYLNDTYSYTGGTIPMSFSQTDAVWAVITDDSGTVWARAKLDVSLGSGSGSGDGMGADDGGWLGSSDNNDSAIYSEGRDAPNMLVGMYWAFGFLTKSELFAASFFVTIILGGAFAYYTKNTLLVILVMELSMGVHVIFKMFPMSLLLISLVVISAFASKKLSGVTS